MKRQDAFLREVLATLQAAQHSPLPGIGLADAIDQIEARLPLLKPVAYENDDLSHGLSGDGIHHICGDKASIRRVKDALHYEAAYKPYVDLLRREQEAHAITTEQNLILRGKIENAQAALHVDF